MPDMRIEIHATARDPSAHAILSLRIDGRQVAQIEHVELTAAEAMTSALTAAIVAIAKEEVRRAG